jgi:predicted NAD-dependent protein-ADP-ribosyltransferase YbiA (DUF1768 family)
MIDSFSGDYRWLSNFWGAPVMYHVKSMQMELPFPTSENAYQFAKIDPSKVTPSDIFGFQMCTAGQSKRKGQKLEIRKDWADVKLGVMEIILRSKFEDELLQWKLVETGTQEIIEGNTWNDTFWGVCNGVGSNHLGKILMKLRKEFHQTNLDGIF